VPDICQTPLHTPETNASLLSSTELGCQQRVMTSIALVLLNNELSSDDQAKQIGLIQEEAGCFTLEGRMLHMFALHSRQMAREVR
jgi:hypothetical protein